MKKLSIIAFAITSCLSLNAGISIYNSSNYPITINLQEMGGKPQGDITINALELKENIKYAYKGNSLRNIFIRNQYSNKTLEIADFLAFNNIKWYQGKKGKGDSAMPNSLFYEWYIKELEKRVIVINLDQNQSIQTGLVSKDIFSNGKHPLAQDIFNNQEKSASDLKKDLKIPE